MRCEGVHARASKTTDPLDLLQCERFHARAAKLPLPARAAFEARRWRSSHLNHRTGSRAGDPHTSPTDQALVPALLTLQPPNRLTSLTLRPPHHRPALVLALLAPQPPEHAPVTVSRRAGDPGLDDVLGERPQPSGVLAVRRPSSGSASRSTQVGGVPDRDRAPAVGRGGERLPGGERLLGVPRLAVVAERWTAAAIASHGSSGETGASEPSTTSTPSSSIQRSGKQRSARPGHSRSVTSRSSSRWAGCTLARDAQAAMRRTSSRVVSCTCSMPPRAPVSSKAASASVTARSPMACTATVEPAGRGAAPAARAARPGSGWAGPPRTRARPSRRRARSTTRCGC